MPATFRTGIDLSLQDLNFVIRFYQRNSMHQQFRRRRFALIFRGEQGKNWMAVYDPIHVTRSYLGEPTRHGIRFKQLSDRYMRRIQPRHSPYNTDVEAERGHFIYTHTRDRRKYRAYFVFDFQIGQDLSPDSTSFSPMERNLLNISIISVQDVFTEYDLGNEDLEPHYEEEFNIEADYEEEAICGEELYYTIMDLD